MWIVHVNSIFQCLQHIIIAEAQIWRSGSQYTVISYLSNASSVAFTNKFAIWATALACIKYPCSFLLLFIL